MTFGKNILLYIQGYTTTPNGVDMSPETQEKAAKQGTGPMIADSILEIVGFIIAAPFALVRYYIIEGLDRRAQRRRLPDHDY